MTGAPTVGWVKLHRKLLDWQWIGDPNVLSVFIQIMLRVNREPKMWQGIPIPPGSFLTSRDTLARACGITEKQARRALDVLIRAGTITTNRAGSGQMVSLQNWEEYQGDDAEQGRSRADRRAGSGPKQGRSRAVTREGGEIEKGRSREDVPTGTSVPGQFEIGIDGDGVLISTPGAGDDTPERNGPHPGVQALIDHLKTKLVEHGIAPSMDDTQVNNRRAAWNLLRKLGSDYPEQDPVSSAKALITFATADEKMAPWCTKMTYLFKNAGSIVAQLKAKRNDPRTQSSADRKHELAKHIADFAAEQSTGNVPVG